MAQLSQKTIRLLDRLFNLKGEDNIIIKGIKDEISTTENEMADTTEEKSNNEIQKNDLQGKLTVFQTQADSFKAVFEGIDDATFASLREIGIEFEISKMLTAIDEKAPDYIASLNNQITEFGEKIKNNEEKIKELTNNLEKLNNDQEKAEEDRLKLTSLLDQSLSSSEIEREVLTVNFVKKILSLFDKFDESEIKELTKIIMFPDDGLFEYAQNYEERLANGEISLDDNSSEEDEQPIEEITINEENPDKEETTDNSASTTELYQEEETTIEVDSPKEENENQIIDISNNDSQSEIDLTSLNGSDSEDEVEENTESEENSEIIPVVNQDGESEESEEPERVVEEDIDDSATTIIPVIEPENTQVEESIEEFLEKTGLSIQKFTDYNETPVSEIMAYLNQSDRSLIERNYELLRSINTDEETIYKYANDMLYIADQDLNNKVTILRAKGINDKLIVKYIKEKNSCFRMNYEDFQKRIAAIETMEGNLNEENAYLLNYNVALLEENLNLLNEAGYDLSPEEKRNFCYVLSTSKQVLEDIEILKNYLISITRKNGKYALGIFWQKPYNLITSIDDLVEYNLENLIATNPEVLATNSDNVIRRVKYCEENGIPVSEEGSSISYFDYILNPDKFTKKFGQVELPELPNRNDINQVIPEIISNKDNTNQVQKLYEILKNYYENNSLYKRIDLGNVKEERMKNLLQILTNSLNAELIGKNTYQLNDLFISKNKIERHLAVLLSQIDDIESNEDIDKEIILIAALFNIRQDEETLKKVVSECLNFNKSDSNGGAI